jgi:citrate lyase beta subunit
MTVDYLHLGASLYVPAIRGDLLAIADGRRFGCLRSLIYCTEDAVRQAELGTALANLQSLLPGLSPGGTQHFVRVRNVQVLERVLQMPGVENLAGFVIPKATRRTLPAYLELLPAQSRFRVMPTLESADVFDHCEMRRFRRLLLRPAVFPRILALRIGGNDLLQLLGLRRGSGATVYDTPLGQAIGMLTCLFKPCGLELTAPVVDDLLDSDVLLREVKKDIEHGLLSKSAIHPRQVPLIESQYAVSTDDYEAASSILHPDAAAVFRVHQRMCEPATHAAWARLILERRRIFGLRLAGGLPLAELADDHPLLETEQGRAW